MNDSVRDQLVPFGDNMSPNGDGQEAYVKFPGFRDRLHAAAAKRRLSSSRIASELKLTRGTWSRYWTGDRLPPSDTLIDIAELLDVSERWLIKGNHGRQHLRAADDSDWVEMPEYDLRLMDETGKGDPVGQVIFRRDWLYVAFGESSDLWITRTLTPDPVRNLPMGSALVGKDHPQGERPLEGQHYIFRVNGGVLLARFSYRGAESYPAGEAVVMPVDLDRDEGQHFIIARALGALARPLV